MTWTLIKVFMLWVRQTLTIPSILLACRWSLNSRGTLRPSSWSQLAILAFGTCLAQIGKPSDFRFPTEKSLLVVNLYLPWYIMPFAEFKITFSIKYLLLKSRVSFAISRSKLRSGSQPTGFNGEISPSGELYPSSDSDLFISLYYCSMEWRSVCVWFILKNRRNRLSLKILRFSTQV